MDIADGLQKRVTLCDKNQEMHDSMSIVYKPIGLDRLCFTNNSNMCVATIAVVLLGPTNNRQTQQLFIQQ